MSQLSFQRDVKCLFAKYIDDMKDVKVASKEGSRSLQLGSYDSVKSFYYKIQVAIHGYDFDRDGNPLVATQHLLMDRDNPGHYVKSAPHPMPPESPDGDGRLPQTAIDIFDQWVKDGMQP
ncbi:MAG: hypothetical protein V4660_07210 [Pseudomonadota bacterium]